MPESNERNGHVLNVEGQRLLRFTRRYEMSRTDVWEAITSTERLSRWAFPGTIEPRSGGAVRFDYGTSDSGDPIEGLGTVIHWDAPSLLEYEWTEGETIWQIRFALADDAGGGTVLTFDHLLPDATQPEFAAGWHWHLDRLATLLGGDEPAVAEVDDHFEALMVQYRGESA